MTPAGVLTGSECQSAVGSALDDGLPDADILLNRPGDGLSQDAYVSATIVGN
jgi:hypothetical protein